MTLSSSISLRLLCPRARIANKTLGWIHIKQEPIPWTTGEWIDPEAHRLVLVAEMIVGVTPVGGTLPDYQHQTMIGVNVMVAVVRRGWLSRMWARLVYRLYGWRV